MAGGGGLRIRHEAALFRIGRVHLGLLDPVLPDGKRILIAVHKVCGSSGHDYIMKSDA
jgi:hypothetical protein